MGMPKVLLYDIETSPNIGAYFQLYREGNIVWTVEHWHVLSFSWKWLDEKTTHVCALPDYKLYKKDPKNDLELVKELWSLLDQADIIISHNGVAFDNKKTLSRFIYHSLPPPTPYLEMDTKLIAKKYFKFDSNKLDDLGDYLKLGRKLQHGGMELWKGCLEGDMKCWKLMKAYNVQDTILLEKIYLKMRPYIQQHPNIALFRGKVTACPNCGSIKMERRGYRLSRVSRFQRYQCTECGSWHSRPIPKDESFPKQMR